MMIGAALSASGVTFQGVFRNPLVSPFILGVSGGVGFGAAVAILLDGGTLAIQLSAFGFGALAVIVAVLPSRAYSSNPTLVLVLSGIITALLGLLKYVSGFRYVVIRAFPFFVESRKCPRAKCRFSESGISLYPFVLSHDVFRKVCNFSASCSNSLFLGNSGHKAVPHFC